MPISIKTAEEIRRMRVAGRLAAQVLEMIQPHVRPGVSTIQLDRICHDYITQELDSIPAPLNYRGFPKSICTSVNQVVCHGIPGPTKLRRGDILNIDVTVIKDGYHGDTSRMFLVGDPAPRARRLVQTCYECLRRAILAVRPGTPLGIIGRTVQKCAEAHRFTVVQEYCGHGIGKNFHEPPQVMHFDTDVPGPYLRPGMTFTIEPMLNMGKRHVDILADRWTVVTRDRSWSAQWEHTILVTPTGREVLTKRHDEQF